MHKLFIDDLRQLEVKKEFLEGIAFQLEYAYYNDNKDNSEKETTLNKRLSELKIEMERIDEKFYVKEEMNKEKFDKLMLKLMEEEKDIYKNMEECTVTISNLQENIIEAGELCSKLPILWAKSDISEKEKLQKLVYPEGLSYDKKIQAFRTAKKNEAFSQIARLSGNLDEMTKGLNINENVKSLLAEREGFEPSVPVSQYDSLANCSFRPLRHLSLIHFGNANVEKDFLK